jgi:methylthioribose-1-phosphate isomerase
MKNKEYFALKFENDTLHFIDQTKLPFEENYFSTDSFERIAEAIEKLEIRGAPLIGIAAAYAIALAFKNYQSKSAEHFDDVYKRLTRTRPTAVNLFYAANLMKEKFEAINEGDDIYLELLKKAQEIENSEISYSQRISKFGLSVFQKKSRVLTHCNTGSLAAASFGTALGIIKNAYEHNLIERVFVDETRPLLQGLRLTAFELDKFGIPFTILTDSMSSSLMQNNQIDLVVVGADRIALNGDTANKIGTLSLAIICYYFNVPFYVAAPSSTIDKKIVSGEEIIIEHRSGKEIYSINNILVAKEDWDYYSPAFDVTPAHLITGIITEKNIYRFPYNFLNE